MQYLNLFLGLKKYPKDPTNKINARSAKTGLKFKKFLTVKNLSIVAFIKVEITKAERLSLDVSEDKVNEKPGFKLDL